VCLLVLQGARAVLSGDPCQLAPTVISPEASVGGLNVSLIERVFQEASFVCHTNGGAFFLRPPSSATPASAAHGPQQGSPTPLPGSPSAALSAGAPAGKQVPEGAIPGAACCMLETQYRMNASIAHWSSDKLYGGRLRAAPAVANQLLADLPPVEVRTGLTINPYFWTLNSKLYIPEECSEPPCCSPCHTLLRQWD